MVGILWSHMVLVVRDVAVRQSAADAGGRSRTRGKIRVGRLNQTKECTKTARFIFHHFLLSSSKLVLVRR